MITELRVPQLRSFDLLLDPQRHLVPPLGAAGGASPDGGVLQLGRGLLDPGPDHPGAHQAEEYQDTLQYNVQLQIVPVIIAPLIRITRLPKWCIHHSTTRVLLGLLIPRQVVCWPAIGPL